MLAFYDFFSPPGVFFSFSSDNHTQKQTDDNDRNNVEDNIAKNDHVVMMMMMMTMTMIMMMMMMMVMMMMMMMMIVVVTIGYEATSVQNMQ